MPVYSTALTITAQSASAIALAWSGNDEATTFNVFRAPAIKANSWSGFQQVNGSPVVAQAYTDNAVAANASYVYYVQSLDGLLVGNISGIAAATAATPAQRVPGDFEGDILNILPGDPMADDATYTRYGYGPVAIRGWYDNANADDDTGMGKLNNSTPCFTTATALVENAGAKDLLVVAGITYKVKSVDPDGTGVTILWLSRDGSRP